MDDGTQSHVVVPHHDDVAEERRCRHEQPSEDSVQTGLREEFLPLPPRINPVHRQPGENQGHQKHDDHKCHAHHRQELIDPPDAEVLTGCIFAVNGAALQVVLLFIGHLAHVDAQVVRFRAALGAHRQHVFLSFFQIRVEFEFRKIIVFGQVNFVARHLYGRQHLAVLVPNFRLHLSLQNGFVQGVQPHPGLPKMGLLSHEGLRGLPIAGNLHRLVGMGLQPLQHVVAVKGAGIHEHHSHSADDNQCQNNLPDEKDLSLPFKSGNFKKSLYLCSHFFSPKNINLVILHSYPFIFKGCTV